MATIESYPTANGKRYQVRYRTPQRTQTKRRGFATMRAAKEFAATVEVEKMRGEYVAPSLGLITVGELAPAWLARKESDVAHRATTECWKARGASMFNRLGAQHESLTSNLTASSSGLVGWAESRGPPPFYAASAFWPASLTTP
jgi:hypothetical protein